MHQDRMLFLSKIIYSIKHLIFLIKKYIFSEIHNRTDLINFLIKKYKFQTYLEIGIGNGKNFKKIRVKHKEACDPYYDKCDGYCKEVLTYHEPSDIMFQKMGNGKLYDLIFIDGLHEAKQVLKDIANSLNHLNENGYILIHDSLPPSKEYTYFPRTNQTYWNGTVYKVFPILLKSNLKFSIIDLDFGIGIIRGNQNQKKLFDFQDLDYSYEDIFQSEYDYKRNFDVIDVKELKRRVKFKH